MPRIEQMFTATEVRNVRTNTQHALVGLLHAELDIGTTFAHSALLSYDEGHMDHYAQAKAYCLKAIESIKNFIVQVADVRVQTDIRERLSDLERLFSTL